MCGTTKDNITTEDVTTAEDDRTSEDGRTGKDRCPWDRDPPELRSLKRELANINCNCRRFGKGVVTDKVDQIHEGIQVESRSDSLDCQIQVTPTPSSTGNTKVTNEVAEALRKDIFCPTCLFTRSLLLGGITKILKDEEIETKFEIMQYNKSTEHVVACLEKTTSITNKPVLKYSNLSLCDYISERTSATSVCSNDTFKSSNKRSGNREVTFLLNCEEQEMPINDYSNISPPPLTAPTYVTTFKNCLCVDELIESIRPPLTYYDW